MQKLELLYFFPGTRSKKKRGFLGKKVSACVLALHAGLSP